MIWLYSSETNIFLTFLDADHTASSIFQKLKFNGGAALCHYVTQLYVIGTWPRVDGLPATVISLFAHWLFDCWPFFALCYEDNALYCRWNYHTYKQLDITEYRKISIPEDCHASPNNSRCWVLNCIILFKLHWLWSLCFLIMHMPWDP